MTQKIKNETTRLSLDFENYQSVFSEETHIEAAEDHVIIMFVQKISGVPENHPNGKVVSRVIMTWPEFARTSKLFATVLQRNKGMAQESFINSVMQEAFEPHE